MKFAQLSVEVQPPLCTHIDVYESVESQVYGRVLLLHSDAARTFQAVMWAPLHLFEEENADRYENADRWELSQLNQEIWEKTLAGGSS
jgi:hypothetical protein